MGVAVIDIGGGTTDIAIFRNDGLCHTQILDMGGNHLTNDLAEVSSDKHSMTITLKPFDEEQAKKKATVATEIKLK